MVASLVAPVVFATPVGAVAPTLVSVGQQERHLTAAFVTPKADTVVIYVASKPDVATDGHFFDENVVSTDYLTDSEIQSGNYLDQGQLDPGSYFVMLSASPEFPMCRLQSEATDPTCADGMSSILPLTVPAPATKWSAITKLVGSRVELRLTADLLGIKQPYRVCWRTAAKNEKCAAGRIDGYSWRSSADDELIASASDLSPGTTRFTWTTTDATPKTLATQTLTIPKPKWSVKTELLRNFGILSLTLAAKPLGIKQPYRLCWQTKAKRTKCLKGSVDGYSWHSSASDFVQISTKGLASRTKFTWATHGARPKVLLTKTIATPAPKY